MSKKSTSTTPRKRLPPEENLHDEVNFRDLLVSDEDLAKHTAHADDSVTHDQVRKALSKIKGSLADDKEGFELVDPEAKVAGK